ncbi:MAG: biotin/lipoyl-binding protein [Armatimonadetes bacterium]|nr:biotin/lipoyl-binding protein [Armatimonadota bacterium]
MSEIKSKIDELASLMNEYGLETARLKGDDYSIEFSVHPPMQGGTAVAMAAAPAADQSSTPVKKTAKKAASPSAKAAPTGTPISSPMTGIFYSASSPGSPPFAKEGDNVQAGQVVGLIEAMKVFNEITAPVSGVVSKVAVENGQLVNPGDAILYIG